MIAGRYSLDREIGRGGAGVVWLGRDEVLGRPVALKRIGLLAGDSQTDVARAEREARLAAQLHHPHVVSIFDAVTDAESGARWLVMEYVDGVSLAQHVRDRGRLSADEAAPLLRQTADALAAAHAVGITHRDVKPSNIMVTRGGHAKLTDFGIARITNDVTLTQTGMMTGSPAYLAPEVVEGERGTEAADVWSFGAMVFHVLDGRPPYDLGDNVIAGLYKIVHDAPPRPAEPGWLGVLLDATLVKDPAQRWSMAQVRDFIAAAGEVSPTMTPPQHVAPVSQTAPAPAETLTQQIAPSRERQPAPQPSQPLRPPQSRRGVLLAVLAVLVALLVGVGSYALLRDRSPSSNSSAAGATPIPSASPGVSPSASPTSEPAAPTAASMSGFIRDYVAAVADDPATSWDMLTPKFQRESGGIAKYSAFWDSATTGEVTSITADPDNLTVSYQVRFENHDNGPGPTVLQLTYDDGTYLIDGESTRGFTPSP